MEELKIKPDSIILTTNIRDEDNILEWIAYHTLIGFDYIIICDHMSKIPITDILSNYEFKNVKVIRIDKENILKKNMMNQLLQISKQYKARWSIHLDGDEYLSLNGNYNSVRDFLSNYDDYDIIPIAWVHFGSNYHSKKPDGLVIENFTKSQYRNTRCVIKTFINVNNAIKYNHPHMCVMALNSKGITMDMQPWNNSFMNGNSKGIEDKVYISHYSMQSYEDYLRRKICRARDDNRKTRTLIEENEFHTYYNDTDNTFLKDNYAEKVKEFLKERRKKVNSTLYKHMEILDIRPNSIILTTNMRDEYTIPEWIAYHTLIGFDYILIYDHCSIIPIEETLKKYSFKNVYVFRDNNENTKKTTMMNKLLNIAKKYKVEWMIHLDADEYLSLNGYYKVIKDFIDEYKNIDAIPITWIHFGTNNHSKNPPGLVIENFTKSTIKIKDSAIKTFIKVDKAIKYNNPHWCRMDKNIVGKTIHGENWTPCPFVKNNLGIKEKVYINHYIYQSYEEYYRRKCSRRRDDNGGMRPILTEEVLHTKFNEVNNTFLKDNYAKLIKKFLKDSIKRREQEDLEDQYIVEIEY